MKKTVFACIFMFGFLTCNSQNIEFIIDSLKTALVKNRDAKKTASIYSDLTWYYSNVSIDSALHYGTKAANESRKLGDSVLLAQVYSDIGAVYFRKGDFQKSKENYQTAYNIRKIRKDYNGMAKISVNLGGIFQSLRQYKPAMKAYLEAIKYFESTNNEAIVNATKVNVGHLFSEIKNYPKAIKYISEAIEYEDKNNLSGNLCTSCLNLGNVYMHLQDTVTALKYYNKSLKNCTLAGNKKGIASVYNNIGNIKTAQRKSADALALYDKSQDVRKELNATLDKSTLKINIANEYIQQRKFKEALGLLSEIRKVFEKNDSDDNLLLTYKLLVPVFANLNQPDSVTFYSDSYAALKEKSLENAALKQTSELEAKYQTEKKEKLLLQKEAEARQKNIMLITISILAVLTAIIGFLIFRQQRLKNTQLAQEHELKSAISKIETQSKLQEQRLSISRDLHDNIGAQLTFIISAVDNIQYAFEIQNPKLDGKLQNISNFAKSTIIELRDTIWAMNSNEISFDELQARIMNFINSAKEAKSGVAIEFNINPRLAPLKLSSIAGMNIYRTIQEAINNSLKYSDASSISIDAFDVGDAIKITIADNGIGFDKTTTLKGNGLQNMEKRIEDIGGIFNLVSQPNHGTEITIILKMNSNIMS